MFEPTQSDYRAECCENIQQDLLCLLDGLDNELLTKACQVIVDRFEELSLQVQGMYME